MSEPATLLVIDDQASVRKIVRHTLRNYTVLEAGGAEPAIEVLRSNAVDLILCDVMMPGCDGFERRLQPRQIVR